MANTSTQGYWERRDYPLQVEGHMETSLSRGLWIVKWLLLIPHYIVLAFLWIGVFFVSVIAFFAILFTAKYPRSLFNYTVGVMRWTWRVSFYGYSALGTDRYPPFALRDVPEYPAHLNVAYPERLSRGLVLVKWWLLAIPQYIIIGMFLNGASTTVYRNDQLVYQYNGLGLISVLVLIAGVLLLFTARYPQPLFKLVMGLNRWVLRVGAYAGLLTDQYPPHRLDQGETEPELAQPWQGAAQPVMPAGQPSAAPPRP